MALGDAFSDAVADIDRYLLDPWGTSAHGTYSRELAIATRNLMDVVRCLIDAEAMGSPLDYAARGIRTFADAEAEAEAERGHDDTAV
jgi:hypothetical protein